MIAIAAHIAYGDSGQPVGVIDAGLASHRKEIGAEFGYRQAEERHGFGLAAIVKAQLDLIVGAKLQIADAVRIGVQQRQKLVEIGGGGGVGSGLTAALAVADPTDPAIGA